MSDIITKIKDGAKEVLNQVASAVENIDLYETVTATEDLNWPGLVLEKNKPTKVNKSIIERLKSDKEHSFNHYLKLKIIKIGDK